jgi:decaprenyl-phosphate phosphoribosyltransferase
MAQTIYYLLKTARPRQWLKNLAVFAALVFSGFFFQDFPDYVVRVTFTFFVFCLLSSSVYIVNDIVDRESDRQHPYKKKRPIAAGQLPVPIAALVAGGGILGSLIAGWMLSPFLCVLLLSYLGLQISYSLSLKHVSILDVLSIAAGFILRVYAGAVVVNLHMSVWFLLTIISASLFLAVGKRQSERTLLSSQESAGKGFSTRRSLEKYSTRLLDIYTGMFANATWLTYALFAFQREGLITDGPLPTLLSIIPRAFTAEKWLMLTVPVVIYGVMRYLQLVYESNQGESPERVLLQDKPLLTTAMVFGLMVFFIIYILG